jgi:hypothetical protein
MYIPGRIFAAPCLSSLLALLVPFTASHVQAAESMTPLLLAVHDAPIAFTGSDGATHLVYELGMTNFSSGNVFVQKVEVLGDGAVLQMLDTAAVASRLQRVGVREPAGVLAKSTQPLPVAPVSPPRNVKDAFRWTNTSSRSSPTNDTAAPISHGPGLTGPARG